MSRIANWLGAAAFAASSVVSGAAQAADIVVTHWSALLYGVPYAVALEKGYFKEEGVTITGILSSKGGGTSVRNLMAGETLYAEVALPARWPPSRKTIRSRSSTAVPTGRPASG